jgi:hypothetical protein
MLYRGWRNTREQHHKKRNELFGNTFRLEVRVRKAKEELDSPFVGLVMLLTWAHAVSKHVRTGTPPRWPRT